jgi:hypothetical protein
MQWKQCPICFATPEVRDVAPCFMCGGLPSELEDLRKGRHTYSVYRFPTGTEMVLCEICFLDLGSIRGEYWGLPVQHRITTNDLSLVRTIADPQITPDRYCPNCDARVSYLGALREIIDANTGQPQAPPSAGQPTG